jgi:hypothetical protein
MQVRELFAPARRRAGLRDRVPGPLLRERQLQMARGSGETGLPVPVVGVAVVAQFFSAVDVQAVETVIGVEAVIGRVRLRQVHVAIVAVAVEQPAGIRGEDGRPDVLAHCGVEVRAGAGSVDLLPIPRQLDAVGAAAAHRSHQAPGVAGFDAHAAAVEVAGAALADHAVAGAREGLGEGRRRQRY